jgi:hypothetical protein
MMHLEKEGNSRSSLPERIPDSQQKERSGNREIGQSRNRTIPASQIRNQKSQIGQTEAGVKPRSSDRPI